MESYPSSLIKAGMEDFCNKLSNISKNTFCSDGKGKGNIGSWTSAVDCDNSGDNTCTTSTSLWAVCEGWDEETAVGPGCKSWPGVTKEGVAPSFRIELDVPDTEVTDSETLINGITGLGTVLGLSGTDDKMAVLSKTVVNGATNGKLVLRVAVERDCVEALLVIKLDESETIAEDGAGSIEDCKFRVPLLRGGNKGEGDSDKDEADKLEDPEGKDALITGYCIVCCMEGAIDKPGGGRSKDCCWAWNPFGDP